MALQSKPRKLKEIGVKIPQEGDKWSPEYFAKTYEEVARASALKLDTKEGIEDYVNLVPSAEQWDIETARKTHSKLVKLLDSGFAANTLANIGNVAGLLDNNSAENYALSHYAFKTDDKEYNAVAEAITQYHQTAQDIENQPREYLAEAVRKLSDNSKIAFLAMADDVLKGERIYAQEKARIALLRYEPGVKNFIIKNLTRARKLMQEAPDKLKELEGKVQAELDARAVKLGRPLTSPEHVEAGEAITGKYINKYEDFMAVQQALPGMLKDFSSESYKSYKADEKKKKGKGKK